MSAGDPSHAKRDPKEMLPTPGKLARRRLKQRLFSIPEYLREISLVRGKDDLYRWIYFKFPYAFPLADFPTRLTIELTNACNFKCPHCWREVMDRKVGFMEEDLFNKIVHELKPHKARTDLKIIGLGEPCLHPHFREFMGLLRHNSVSPLLYTNGTLLRLFSHEEILDWNIQRLVVSIDGLDARSYERLRAGGKYEVVRKDLQRFYATRKKLKFRAPEIEIRHVIMPDETSKQLMQFKKDWKGLGDGVKFNYLAPPWAREGVESNSRSKCRDVRREFYIEYDGRSPLCGYAYGREHIGDLHRETIMQLWMAPRKQQLRDCHQRGNLDLVPLCKSCSHT